MPSPYVRMTEFENMSHFVTGNIVYISVSLMANTKLICEWESSVAPNHTPRRTTVSRTPLDEASTARRDLYFYKQRSQESDIYAPGGIRTPQSNQGSIHMTTAWVGHSLSFEE